MTDNHQKIIIGVDTHKDFHHVAVISALGESLTDRKFDATPDGYAALIAWVTGQGDVLRAGRSEERRVGKEC